MPAQKPHAARIQRADVVARWEDFERAQAAEEGEGETYSVTQIRSAFAKHASPDDWGVESFYVGVLISALRGEYEEDS